MTVRPHDQNRPSALTTFYGITFENLNDLSLFDMFRLWKFAPAGTFQIGDPLTEAFQARMSQLRAANPGAWVSASKALS